MNNIDDEDKERKVSPMEICIKSPPKLKRVLAFTNDFFQQVLLYIFK